MNRPLASTRYPGGSSGRFFYQLLVTGITIFLSTSYMDEAERAHRVGLLHRGRLMLADTPRAVKENFRGELLEARNGNLHRAKTVLTGQPLVRAAAAHGRPADDYGGT